PLQLAFDDPRRDEDQQLGALIVDRVAPEQPAQQRNPAEPGRLIRRRLLLAHVNATDHGRLPVGHEHLRVGALRVDRRNVVDSATSRLNAPLTAPSCRPTALVAAGTGRLMAVGVGSVAVVVPMMVLCCCPVRPPMLPWFGNARFVVLPSSGATRPLTPHWMPSA